MFAFSTMCLCSKSAFSPSGFPHSFFSSKPILLNRSERTRRQRSALFMVARPAWEVVQGCDVVFPPENGKGPPKLLVHFMGGLGAGAAPKSLYGPFLERLAERGNVAIIATPVGSGFDHTALSRRAAEQCGEVSTALSNRWNTPWIPMIGIGHSLGAKLHILANSDDETRRILGPRVANVLIAFNNYSASKSIPMWDTLRAAAERRGAVLPPEFSAILERLKDSSASRSTLESLGAPSQVASFVAKAASAVGDIAEGIGSGGFIPSEAEVLRRLRECYSVDKNLVISFTRDSLDCAEDLVPALSERFGERGATVRRLPGTHITLNTPEIDDDLSPTGVEALDGAARGAKNVAMTELDDTVTVVAAFLQLNLELLAEQRLLPGQ